MLWAIASFELRGRLRRASTYVFFLLLLAISFLVFTAAAGAFPGAHVSVNTNVKTNCPSSLHVFIGLISYFGVIITAAVMGQAGCQDFECQIHPLLFTTPLRKTQYLAGRFLGAWLLLLAIFSSVAVGLFLGSQMPFIDRELVGPNHLAAYLQPYLVLVVPNMLVTGALFFSLGVLTRKSAPAYLAGVMLLIGWLIATTLKSNLEYRNLAGLLDPFGLIASGRVTEYWTVSEKNSLLVPLQGILLANRALWLGVGALVLGWAFLRFRFAHLAGPARGPAAAKSRNCPRRSWTWTIIPGKPWTCKPLSGNRSSSWCP